MGNIAVERKRDRADRDSTKTILDSITAVNDVCAYINGIIRQKHQTVIIFDHDMTHAVALFFHVRFFHQFWRHIRAQKHKNTQIQIIQTH